MKKKLIFIELNEINFDLVEKYLHDKNFKFFNKFFFSNLQSTDSEEDFTNLEPWIQWTSVHTGLAAKEHKIFRLGDINEYNPAQIFEIIESKGYSVGAICPMNANNKLKKTHYFISDPWTKSQRKGTYFQNQIYLALSEAVNKNAGSKISLKSMFVIILAILFFVRGSKIFFLLKLIFKSLKYKWYKAIIFDYLLHNMHLNYLKKYSTDFSTIFFNAGAHIQHHYLHNSKKIDKSFKKNPKWYVDENLDPILDVYSFYDEIISEYFKFKDYSILIATGLSQNPHNKKNFYYRLKNHNLFLKQIGIDFVSVEPRMSRDFLINFENNHACDEGYKKLLNINELNENKIFEIDKRNKTIFLTLIYDKEIQKDLEIKINYVDKINLYEHVNFVAIKNGEHRSKGYVISFNEVKKYISKEKINVKDLFGAINNYFA